jgi:hypothetical protein
MVDPNALAEALGGDGTVTFETEWVKGSVWVVNGRSFSTMALKKSVSGPALTAALRVMNAKEESGAGKSRKIRDRGQSSIT